MTTTTNATAATDDAVGMSAILTSGAGPEITAAVLCFCFLIAAASAIWLGRKRCELERLRHISTVPSL